MRERGCWADGGSQRRRRRRLGSLVAGPAMLLLFPCKDTSPCVFLFSFLCSYSRFSPLYPCASPLFSLYSFIFFYLCSSSFSFSFVFSLSISLTFFALLCSPLSSPLSFCSLSFFSSSLPLFLKTKIGEGRGWGGHCVAAPPTCGKCGLCRRLFKGKDGGDRGRKKSFSSPALRVQGKKGYSVWIVYETTPFCTKRAISFKRKRRQKNMLEFTLVLNLWFVQSSPQLQFWFKNQCNCIPAKKQTATLKFPAFFTLVLRLEFVQCDPQLINKLLISSI